MNRSDIEFIKQDPDAIRSASATGINLMATDFSQAKQSAWKDGIKYSGKYIASETGFDEGRAVVLVTWKTSSPKDPRFAVTYPKVTFCRYEGHKGQPDLTATYDGWQHYKARNNLTSAQKRELQQEQAQRQAQAEKAAQEQHRAIHETAAEAIRNAEPVRPGDTLPGYFERKGYSSDFIAAAGLQLYRTKFPLKSGGGIPATAYAIRRNGDGHPIALKYCLDEPLKARKPGGKPVSKLLTEGAGDLLHTGLALINPIDQPQRVYIGEGVASCLGAYTGMNPETDTVAIADSASMFGYAFKLLAQKYPHAELIGLAENDSGASLDAIRKIQINYVLPGQSPDFDDLWRDHGPETVRAALNRTLSANGQPCKVLLGAGAMQSAEQEQAGPDADFQDRPDAEVLNHKQTVSEMFRLKMFLKPGASEDLSIRTGLDPEYFDQKYRDYLAFSHSDLHKPKGVNYQKAERFEDAIGMATDQRRSVFVQAVLGGGKTSKYAGPVVQALRAKNTPVMAMFPRRSLTAQGAEKLELVSYALPTQAQSPNELAACINSINSPKFEANVAHLMGKRSRTDTLQSWQPGTALLDEIVTQADLLLGDGTEILSNPAKANILRTLLEMKNAGVQFICLDGDLTPAARVLMGFLGVTEFIDCTYSEYGQPDVEFYPQFNVEDPITGFSCGTDPMKSEIRQRVAQGEPVVVACDSAKQAGNMHDELREILPAGQKILLITDATRGDEKHPEYKADVERFLANPDAEAPKYQVIVHSPIISVGVSITSTQPHVYTRVTSGILPPNGIWQMSRRFRAPANGVVKISYGSNVTRPQRQIDSYDPKEILEKTLQFSEKMLAEAEVSELKTLRDQGLAACEYQKALIDRNPYLAMIGYLTAAGIKNQVKYDMTQKSHDTKMIEQLRQRYETERVATAHRIADDEEAKAKRMEDSHYWALKRYHLEKELVLNDGDLTADGHIPLGLADRRDELTRQVKNNAVIQAFRAGADLSVYDRGAAALVDLGLWDKQVPLIDQALSLLLNEETGLYEFTSSKAEAVADLIRPKYHNRYKMISRPPAKRKATKAGAYNAWLKSWLCNLGFSQYGEKERLSKTGSDQWLYRFRQDPEVLKYSARKAAEMEQEIRILSMACSSDQQGEGMTAEDLALESGKEVWQPGPLSMAIGQTHDVYDDQLTGTRLNDEEQQRLANGLISFAIYTGMSEHQAKDLTLEQMNLNQDKFKAESKVIACISRLNNWATNTVAQALSFWGAEMRGKYPQFCNTTMGKVALHQIRL